MTMRTIMLLLLFVTLTWGGSAGIAFGVVELTGGGPQGEQGKRGERGPTGERGSAGEAARFSTQRMAAMFAVEAIGEPTTHPQTQACIDYIMDNEGSFVECGFTRVE